MDSRFLSNHFPSHISHTRGGKTRKAAEASLLLLTRRLNQLIYYFKENYYGLLVATMHASDHIHFSTKVFSNDDEAKTKMVKLLFDYIVWK